MNRFNRKHMLHATAEWEKHSRPFLKRLGNQKLRREPIGDPPVLKHSLSTPEAE
jgi:hypothetical protein